MERQFPKLKRYKASRKDYSHNKTYPLLGAAPLPQNLYFLSPILNQGDKPSCTAYSAVAIRQSMTGKEYDPEAQWQAELDYMGVKNANGAELRVQGEVALKTGFTPLAGGTPTDKIAAYFFVTKLKGKDWFDTIRETINQIQGTVSAGLDWYRDWDNAPRGIIPNSFQNLLGGHDVKIAGFIHYIDDVDYLLIQNSWGTAMGEAGLYRLNREMANKVLGKYGVLYFSDAPPTQIGKLGTLRALLLQLISLYQAAIEGLGKALSSMIKTKDA